MPHPEQLIACEAAKLFHKSIIKKKPIQIHSLIKFPTHSRECQKISINVSFKTKQAKRSTAYTSLRLYNSLPSRIRCLPIKKFNREIIKYDLRNVPMTD